MLKKGIINFTILVASVATLFILISLFNWVDILRIKSIPTFDETKVGDFLWKQAQYDLNLFNENSKTQITTNKLFKSIISANNLQDTIYQIHINQNSEVNAFAYPGGHIVVNTGLILKCDTEGELMSVMSHELAHLNENHPMQLLKREVGVAILSSIVLGEKSKHVIAQITNTVAGAAYQREEEALADSLGLVYLAKSKKSPQEFINFQKKMEKNETEITKSLEFISTHPNWESRIDALKLQTVKMNFNNDSTLTILSNEEWEYLKQSAQ